MQHLPSGEYTETRIGVGALRVAAVSDDGTIAAVASDVGGVVVFDPADVAATLRALPALDDPVVTALAFAPDGALAVATEGVVEVFDPGSGERQAALELVRDGTPLHPSALAFTPDGRLLASTHETLGAAVWRRDGWVQLVQPEGVALPLYPEYPELRAAGFVFGPDAEEVLARGTADGVELLDPRSGRIVGDLLGHRALVRAVAFSDDGALLASADDSGAVLLWDVRSRRQLGSPLRAADGVPTQVFFAGRAFVAISHDGSVTRWEMDPDAWEQRACRVASRSLTEAEWAELLPGRSYDPACLT